MIAELAPIARVARSRPVVCPGRGDSPPIDWHSGRSRDGRFLLRNEIHDGRAMIVSYPVPTSEPSRVMVADGPY